MVTYLFGPDAYRKRIRKSELVSACQKTHPHIIIASFDAEEEEDIEALGEFLKRQPLFGDEQLVLVSGFSGEQPVLEAIRRAAKDSSLCLIVTAGKKYAGLPQEISYEEFTALAPREFASFVEREAHVRGIRISPGLVWALREAAAETWGVVTELDKIALGAEFEAYAKKEDFFSLVGRLARGAISARLSALSLLLETEEPARIFNILTAFLDAARKEQMADYDIAVKSGKLEYEETLLDFVLESNS